MENYFTSIEPFYRVAKLFGLFPMNFEEPVRKGNLKHTTCSLLRTGIALLILFGMFMLIIYNHIIYICENQPFFYWMVWSWILIFIFPVITIQLILQILKMKEFKGFFHFMNEIDSKLYQFSVKIDHKRHRKFIYCFTYLWFGMMLIRFCATIFIMKGYEPFYVSSKGSLIVQETSYVFVLFYNCLYSLQFIFITYLLRERFRIINGLLRLVIYASILSFPYISNSIFRYDHFNKNYLDLKLFAEVFHDLCDAIKIINSLLTVHLVSILLAMLFVDVFGMYTIFGTLNLVGNAYSIYNISFYIVLHFILRACIAYIGSSTTNEPEEIIENIAKLINKLSSNHPSQLCLLNYIKQFQTRNSKFQTLFLTINWSIVLGVSLIILIIDLIRPNLY